MAAVNLNLKKIYYVFESNGSFFIKNFTSRNRASKFFQIELMIVSVN